VLDGLLGGHDDLVDAVGRTQRAGPVQDVLLDLLLVADVGVDGVPLDAHDDTTSGGAPGRRRHAGAQVSSPMRLPRVVSANSRKSAVMTTNTRVACVAWRPRRGSAR
jgi:hypothetical protein